VADSEELDSEGVDSQVVSSGAEEARTLDAQTVGGGGLGALRYLLGIVELRPSEAAKLMRVSARRFLGLESRSVHCIRETLSGALAILTLAILRGEQFCHPLRKQVAKSGCRVQDSRTSCVPCDSLEKISHPQ
jgi:hypothetical protein